MKNSTGAEKADVHRDCYTVRVCAIKGARAAVDEACVEMLQKCI